MDLIVRKYGPWAPENFSWLASAHGTDSTETITLVMSLFAAKSYVTSFSLIPGGVTIGLITAVGATQGMYGPYDNAASDGRQVMIGHLYTTKSTTSGGLYQGAALLRHGKVRESNLPTGHGLDSAGKADVAGSITYIP